MALINELKRRNFIRVALSPLLAGSRYWRQ